MTEPTLPALAKAIADEFPELGGRSIAVSEMEAFESNTYTPQLPMVVVALIGENGDQPSSGGGQIKIQNDILVQFMFEPDKYKNEENLDTPFFMFYDYETVRDQLLGLTRGWRSPRGVGLEYRSLEVESNEFAVYLAFRFRSIETWCPPANKASEGPHAFTIGYKIQVPKGQCDDIEQDEETDACDSVPLAHQQ